MSIVRTDALRVGLTLSKDVKNDHGQLLIRAGVEIIERHLLLLKSWGIAEVEVQENIGRVSEVVAHVQEDPELAVKLAACKASLSPLFQHNDLQNPVVQEILDIVMHRKLKLSK